MAKEPEQIELTPQEINSLHERINTFTVTKEDMLIFGKLLHFIVWMQLKIQKSQMTINKLKKIIFGSRTEKRNKKSATGDNKDSSENPSSEDKPEEKIIENNNSTNQPESNQVINLPKKEPVKGHGRNGIDKYIPDEIIHSTHKLLKAGDPCPTQCGGKLYEIKPGGVVQVKGQSCAHVIHFIFDKLRCALCGALFTAEKPENFGEDTHDARFRAILALNKYFLAVPFHRQEQYQKMLHLPLSDATQFDLVEQVADCVYPVMGVLEKLAANGELIHNDDSPVKILEIIKANKADPNRERKGTYTTCIFAYSGIYQICLYYSGIRHAGENLTRVLKLRDENLPPIVQMCDALSANVPSELKVILCNCLVHGRRKFTDIESYFPSECTFVIDQLALIYKHDAEAKKQNMLASERLEHHQKFSQPIMDALKIWLKKQMDDHLVEPNSALGAAIKYMLKHWEKLTRFLSVAGAPLDNNIVERSLKLAIRLRKNSMFHRTRHGADIASIILSLIYTCGLADINPVDYLTSLQEHKSQVFKNPENWLPWNYAATLDAIINLVPHAA